MTATEFKHDVATCRCADCHSWWVVVDLEERRRKWGREDYKEFAFFVFMAFVMFPLLPACAIFWVIGKIDEFCSEEPPL